MRYIITIVILLLLLPAAIISSEIAGDIFKAGLWASLLITAGITGLVFYLLYPIAKIKD